MILFGGNEKVQWSIGGANHQERVQPRDMVTDHDGRTGGGQVQGLILETVVAAAKQPQPAIDDIGTAATPIGAIGPMAAPNPHQQQ